jgi:decaprenylphospho-beta-D-erythro-pentofuranosid-2-ulose 2-reductase
VSNGLGVVSRVVVLGGTSAIAGATTRRWAVERPGLEVVIAARPTARRSEAAADLERLGARVHEADLDVSDDASCRAGVAAALAVEGDIDVVVVAFGVLGDQEAAWQDLDAALALADVDYRAAVTAGVLAAARLRSQGHGTLVLLSSVAGERARRSNFPYGAAKAGADAFYLGLAEAVRADGVEVLVVRPGFVDSPMTAGLRRPPLSSTPEEVAAAIVAGVRAGGGVVWVPGALRWVMSALRHLPAPVFRRLPL